MTEEPASLILKLLRQMRAELEDVRSEPGDEGGFLKPPSARAMSLYPTCTWLRADVAADS